MKAGYTKVGVSEEIERLEEGGASNPLHSSTSQLQPRSSPEPSSIPAPVTSTPTFSLKILIKEQSHQVTGGLSVQSTVLDLKTEIEKVIPDVPLAQQRLIFSGRPLKPDTATLSSFKIDSQATIHLFPLPLRSTVTSTTTNSDTTSTRNNNSNSGSNFSTSLALQSILEPPAQHPIYFDPEISIHAREIRLWSVILIFLSGMTLFNNITYNMSTGKFGNNALDVVVSLTETACSAAGMYVAQLGLNSVRSMDLATIRKYVMYLQVLAVVCILMRIAWVFDVIVQVQDAVNRAKQNADGGDGSYTPPQGPGLFTDDANANIDPQKLNNQVVQSFAFQATLIAVVCIAAWVNCVYRARLLRQSVTNFNDAAPGAGAPDSATSPDAPAATATVTTV